MENKIEILDDQIRPVKRIEKSNLKSKDLNIFIMV